MLIAHICTRDSPASLIPAVRIYLTHFQNRVFVGEFEARRDFRGGKKLPGEAVNPGLVNQGAALGKVALRRTMQGVKKRRRGKGDDGYQKEPCVPPPIRQHRANKADEPARCDHECRQAGLRLHANASVSATLAARARRLDHQSQAPLPVMKSASHVLAIQSSFNIKPP